MTRIRSADKTKALAAGRPSFKKRRLTEPGYAGQLDQAELEYLLERLARSPRLSQAWGFRPVQLSRSPRAVQRVALWGVPGDREHNARLVRGRGGSARRLGPNRPAGKNPARRRRPKGG